MNVRSVVVEIELQGVVQACGERQIVPTVLVKIKKADPPASDTRTISMRNSNGPSNFCVTELGTNC